MKQVYVKTRKNKQQTRNIRRLKDTFTKEEEEEEEEEVEVEEEEEEEEEEEGRRKYEAACP